jgi:hypothetical protein
MHPKQQAKTHKSAETSAKELKSKIAQALKKEAASAMPLLKKNMTDCCRI